VPLKPKKQDALVSKSFDFKGLLLFRDLMKINQEAT